MSLEGQQFYPGSEASPELVLELANEYRDAAELLFAARKKGNPLSRAPFRLVAIQAIELYLNAFLLGRGHSHRSVRGLQHRMAERSKRARAGGLELRGRTELHLQRLTDNREYLAVRYAPIPANKLSELNRLSATLAEVATKVAEALNLEK